MNQLPICEIDALDGVTRFEYDDFGRTVAVTDPEGLCTAFAHDANGNMTSLIRPDGTALQLEYDEHDQMVALTTPDGADWRQVYSPQGQLITQIDPLGASTHYVYDARGQLTSQTNAKQAVTQLRYDRHGLVAAVVDALGHESRYEHDSQGNLLRQIDPLGQTSRYEYDVKGRLLGSIGVDGAAVRCEYDAEDQLVRYIDEAGAQTRLQYVGIGQIGKRVQADGHSVEYRYNTEEQLVAVINQRGETYQLVRDALGRIIEEIDYWGQSRRYVYDAAGRLTTSIDPLGQRIAFSTDKLGRITRKTLPDIRNPAQQIHESFVYDKQGQLVELRNPVRAMKRRYDPLGQLLEEQQDGFRVGYAYDEVGNRVLRETSAGNTVAFGYDLRGQAISVAINDEAPIRMERDALGRTTQETLSPHLQRNFTYDSRNLLTSQSILKDAAPLFETTYDYDRSGNLTGRNDSAQGADEYRYDAIGRLLQHTDPKGRIERFFNDPAGDRLRTEIKQAQARKVVGGNDDDLATWTREGTYQNVHYVFDRAGDLVRKGNPQGSAPDDLELIWDANHRLAESRKNGQTTYYGYDPLGRRVFKRNPTQTTWFFWDGDALLGEVQQANDDDEAAPVWVGNVANLLEVKARQRKLAVLHERAREYVYYPGTFVPLALLEPVPGEAGYPAVAGVIEREAEPVERSVVVGEASFAKLPKKVEPVDSLGELGGIRLGGNSLEGARTGQDEMSGRLGLQVGALGGSRLVSPSTSVFEPVLVAQEKLRNAGCLGASVVEGELIEETSSRNQIYIYCVDVNGFPTRLTTTEGRQVWVRSSRGWGLQSSSEVQGIGACILLQGQYQDHETGLSYNRFRYYDPNAGQFISKDPLGLEAGENVYEIGPNIYGWSDPLGLTCALTQKLQSFVDRAVKELAADPKMAQSLMGEGSYRALRNGTGLYGASFGKAVERRVAQLIREDPQLRNAIAHTGLSRGSNGQFVRSVDFTGTGANPKKWDVTTNAGKAGHAERYRERNEDVTILTYDVIKGLPF